MIAGMLLGGDKSGTPKIIDIFLRENVDLLRFIAQWGFWKHRPDIVKTLDGEDCARIVERGRITTNSLLTICVTVGMLTRKYRKSLLPHQL